MGLDMFLIKKVYDQTETVVISQEEVAYWRKANAIHHWFVENVQNGIDECEPHVVPKAQLVELMKLCEDVLSKTKLVPGIIVNGQTYENGKITDNNQVGEVVKDYAYAEEHLPTRSGFFFGNTEYNQWYIEDLENTVTMLKKALDEDVDGHSVFEYCSSW